MFKYKRSPIMGIGYHYTSSKNWESIKFRGLQPYTIDKPELEQYFDYPPLGVWVWIQELSPYSELGSLIYQLSRKCDTKIVKLKVTFAQDDTLTYHGNGYEQPLHLYHSGAIEKWQYHPDNPQAVIVTAPIEPPNIQFIKEFDLMTIVDKGRDENT